MSGDKDRYLRWLEERWEAYKLDLYGSTAHENERTEAVLEMLKELGELATRRIDPPELATRRIDPPEPPQWGESP